MKLHHMAHEKIEQISKRGNFDDVLFFGEEVHYMLEDRPFHYTIDADSVELVSVAQFDRYESNAAADDVVNHLAKVLGADADSAFSVLMEELDLGEFDCDDFGFLQVMQVRYAKALGFDGAISEDEQGAVYMVSMFGKENLLSEV